MFPSNIKLSAGDVMDRILRSKRIVVVCGNSIPSSDFYGNISVLTYSQGQEYLWLQAFRVLEEKTAYTLANPFLNLLGSA
jgi:hypothetical protein